MIAHFTAAIERRIFVAGVLAGVILGIGATVVLGKAGVIDTGSTYVSLGTQFGVWDTGRASAPKDWKALGVGTERVASARNVVANNGAFRLRYDGSESDPGH